MKVFVPIVREGYQWLAPIDDRDFETFLTLGGAARRASWSAVPVKLVNDDGAGHAFLESDFPWLGQHVLILRRQALDAVGPFLADYGEFLPLTCDEAGLWAFNVTCVLDALDMERSAITYAKRTAGIMMIDSHVFRPDVINRCEIFKLPQLLRGPMFVGERFVELVQSSGLRGLGFKLLWDSEVGEASS